MMNRTPDMFADLKPPRAPRRVLMHVEDAGEVHHGAETDLGKPMCTMKCMLCGAVSGWLVFDTVSEAKRGVPCETCNS